MSWPRADFESLYAEPSKNGLTRPARVRGSGYKMINMGELFANDRIVDIPMELVPMNERELSTMLVEPGDLLFARQSLVLAGAGKCCIVRDVMEPTTFESHIIRVRLKRDKADPSFFFYYFRSPRCGIRSIVTQGVQAGIRGNDLKRLPVHVPPITEQAAIASILTAYDDLIENNRRRIQLLEQAARLLYKEWFVHLRFPGHEHVTITDGVPEGWNRVSISSLCNVGRGGSPRPIKDFLDGTVPWYKIGDATASESPFVFSTSERIIEDGVKKSVFLPPQELILSNSATCGIPYFTGVSGCIHDGWLYFKALKRISKWFLYCGLFAKQQEILMGIGEGATQKNLNTDYIGRQLFLMPSDQLLLKIFDDAVAPFFSQIFSLAQQNLQLTKARDLLLPRLMNGEIAA